MMWRPTILAIGMCVASMSWSATAQSGPQSQGADEADEEPLICRRVARTGSHLRGPRVCRTEAEWNRNADMQQERARRLVGNSAIGMGDDPRPPAGTCCD